MQTSSSHGEGMASFEPGMKTQPGCFLDFLMRRVVEYNRIKGGGECRLCNVKALMSMFELWVFKKQLHFLVNVLGVVSSQLFQNSVSRTQFQKFTVDGILHNNMKNLWI